MGLIGDRSPSCGVCSGTCTGVVSNKEPISLKPLREQENMVQSPHLDTTDVGDKEVAESESEKTDDNARTVLRRSYRHQADRAHRPEANRAHQPGDDR